MLLWILEKVSKVPVIYAYSDMWTIKQQVSLEINRELEDDEDKKAFVVMQVMFKNDSADFIDTKKTDDEKLVDKKDIQSVQTKYMTNTVSGKLVFCIPNGRTLTTFSGSSKSKMNPRIKVSCNSLEVESKPSEGTDPSWDFKGELNIESKQSDELDVTISVHSDKKFLGHMVIPFWKLCKHPETWIYNDYYDIYEQKDKLSKGEKSGSLGLIYVQMKWSPEGNPSTSTYPTFVTNFS